MGKHVTNYEASDLLFHSLNNCIFADYCGIRSTSDGTYEPNPSQEGYGSQVPSKKENNNTQEGFWTDAVRLKSLLPSNLHHMWVDYM